MLVICPINGKIQLTSKIRIYYKGIVWRLTLFLIYYESHDQGWIQGGHWRQIPPPLEKNNIKKHAFLSYCFLGGGLYLYYIISPKKCPYR
jgi:hypothetical protein